MTNFIPSGIDGAGFQNHVFCSPDGATQFYCGDVAGLHQSRDGGRTWRQSNRGLPDKTDSAVASGIFETNSIAYAATLGGFHYSTNANVEGPTWTQLTNAVEFRAGNVSEGGLPSTHPRSVGRLLCLGGNSTTASRKWLYMASFNDGVYRTPSGTATAPARIVGTANSNIYLRSIATDAVTNTTLYAAAFGGTANTGGLYRVINANGSTSQNAIAPSWSKMTTPFDSVEEVVSVTGGGGGSGSRVYVVGSSGTTDGVWTATNPTGTSSGEWARLGSGTLPTNADWCSIDAWSRTGASDVILVGAADVVVFSGNLKAHLFRSTNAGSTWQVLPTSASTATTSTYVKSTMGDAGGDTWWHYTDQPAARLGTGSSVVVSSITSDPNNRNNLYIAGRGGGWVCRDILATNPTFYPAVHNLNATINPDVVSDPFVPGRVLWTSVDWGVIYSTDYGASVTNRSVGMSGVYCSDIDTSTVPGTVYIGGGGRDLDDNGNQTGGALKRSANFVTTAFSDVGTNPFNGNRPIGLKVRRISGATNVLTFVAADGVWLYNGTTWTRKKAVGTNSFGTGESPANKRAPVEWASDNLAYIFDPQTGLWRGSTTTSRLDTWTKVWTQVSQGRSTNWIAVDPNDSGRVFASVTAGLFRIDNADAGTATVTKITNVSNAGPVKFPRTPDGNLYLWTTGSAAQWLRASNYTSNTPTWTDDANGYFQDSGQFPNNVDMRTPGNVYTASEGTGGSMASGLLLSGVGIPATVTFGSHTVQGGQPDITPGSIEATVTLGSPTVVGGVASIEATGIEATVTFGDTTVTLADLTLTAEGFAATVEFGSPTVETAFPGRRRGWKFSEPRNQVETGLKLRRDG